MWWQRGSFGQNLFSNFLMIHTNLKKFLSFDHLGGRNGVGWGGKGACFGQNFF